jgi:DNA-binding response OmpR family regulator
MENIIFVLKEKSILFVDDDDGILNKTSAILAIMFKSVYTAKNGKEAFEAYEDMKPDFILSDLRMPIMNGLELAAKIRQTNKQIPIILFSAYSEQKDLLKAINLQISGYIVKPSNLNEMVEIFGKCINTTALQQPKLIDFGNNIIYNQATRELYQDGKIITLGNKEEPLLRMLIESHPSVVTKESISETIWPLESIGRGYIKNVIVRLRSKIGNDNIVSVQGIGWRLKLSNQLT